MTPKTYTLDTVGIVRSELQDPAEAPKQGSEGAPDAIIEIDPKFAQAIDGMSIGDRLIIVTWFHLSDRDVLKVHPRSDPRNQLTGVFSTRSPDRPNPLGFHPVTVRAISGNNITVGPIEAVDGTPVIDIKPIIDSII